MPAYHTRTGQLGLVSGIRQVASDLILSVEPAALFAPEARKGQLYLLVEAEPDLAKGRDACQLVASTIRTAFYQDSSFSITAALRDAVRVANKALYEHNFAAHQHLRTSVGVSCAVLRGNDLYVAQVTPGQAYVLSGGKLRALPTHPSWNSAHFSASPFLKLGALGTSLTVEADLYRCVMRPGDALLLCSSNLARLLGREQVEQLLRYQDPSAAVDSLFTICQQNGLAEAHALALELLPPLSPAARSAPLSPSGIGERASLAIHSLGDWFAGLTGEAALVLRGKAKAAKDPAAPPTLTHPDGLLTDPLPRPRPIDLGESLEERLAQEKEGGKQKAERPRREAGESNGVPQEAADSAPTYVPRGAHGPIAASQPPVHPPSSFLGEQSYQEPPRPIDLSDAPMLNGSATAYRPKYEQRPTVDMSWGERLLMPFQWLNATASQGIYRPGQRNRAKPQPQPRLMPARGKGLSYRRQSPPFPWIWLVLLVLLVSVFVLYGINLSRTRAQQDNTEYIIQAEQRMAAVRSAENDSVALDRLENARQAIDEVRASPLVTTTNPDAWLRYQELQREYERALSSLQRITYIEDATVLATHPLPNGRFSSVVAPPPVQAISDTTALRYIYALDASKESGRLYRVPLAGGTAEEFLKPNDAVLSSVVGPIRAQAWREDNIVAVDQGPGGFSYYFRSGGAWLFSTLAGSELWTLKDRLDIEIYDGNLYVWGAEVDQVLKYNSGRYADLPLPWINLDQLQGRDLSNAIDLAVDGKVYLLQPNGTVVVLSANAFEREIVPEPISPPITTVTRFSISDAPDAGFVFLVDTLNERIIQLDKKSGKIIQQIQTRPNDSLRLNQLTDIFVDASTKRPVLYIVNGGQIIRADLPAPPRPFRTSDPTPVATPQQ